jgi:type III secretion protein T
MTDAEILAALRATYSDYVITLVFVLPRILGVLQIFPLFTTINLRGTVRATFAIALAVPIVPGLSPAIVALVPSGPFVLAPLIAKEFMIGVALGCLIAIPFWGLQAAGDLVDFGRSASAANLADPVNANENSLAGVIFLYAGLAIFVLIGGLQTVLFLLYESFVLFPPDRLVPIPGPDLPQMLGQFVQRMFVIGVALSGPFIIAMAVIDVALGIGSKIAKQVPINDLSVILKNLCVAAFIPLYVNFLQHYLTSDWAAMMQFLRGFLGLPDG